MFNQQSFRPNYALGGDHPNQTARLQLSNHIVVRVLSTDDGDVPQLFSKSDQTWRDLSLSELSLIARIFPTARDFWLNNIENYFG